MGSISILVPITFPNYSPLSSSATPSSSLLPLRRFPLLALSKRRRSLQFRPLVLASSAAGVASNSLPRNGTFTVGDFMTTKEYLHVVKPSTTVDQGIVCRKLKPSSSSSSLCFLIDDCFFFLCLQHWMLLWRRELPAFL